LTRDEVNAAISQNVISNDFAKLPWVYTQLGCNHFGTSLNSEQAYRLAVQLSKVFTDVQTGKIRAPRRALYSIGDLYQQGAKIVDATIKVAKLFGTDKTIAAAEAVHAVRRITPEVDFSPLLVGNTAKTQDQRMNPTQLGKSFGLNLKPQAVNAIFVSAGLQYKEGDHWVLTEKGKEFGVYENTAKKHSNGTTIQQIKWHHDRVEQFLKLKAVA
jgi:hypothetical protein